jgi:1,4-alpha-glucan branching enzyme
MLDYEKHATLKKYTAALNAFYLRTPQLWEIDFSYDGFKWIYADMKNENLFCFKRFDKAGNELIAVMNFSGILIKGLHIPSDFEKYLVAFSSDDTELGGDGLSSSGIIGAFTDKSDEMKYIKVDLAPLSGMMLTPIKDGQSENKQKITEEVFNK